MDHERDEASVTTHQIKCQECGRTWVDPTEPWRTFLTDDEPAALVSYCPACARREFDV